MCEFESILGLNQVLHPIIIPHDFAADSVRQFPLCGDIIESSSLFSKTRYFNRLPQSFSLKIIARAPNLRLCPPRLSFLARDTAALSCCSTINLLKKPRGSVMAASISSTMLCRLLASGKDIPSRLQITVKKPISGEWFPVMTFFLQVFPRLLKYH